MLQTLSSHRAASFAQPFVLERWRYKFATAGRVTINCLVRVSARGRFSTVENKYKIVSRENVCVVERPLFINYFFPQYTRFNLQLNDSMRVQNCVLWFYFNDYNFFIFLLITTITDHLHTDHTISITCPARIMSPADRSLTAFRVALATLLLANVAYTSKKVRSCI